VIATAEVTTIAGVPGVSAFVDGPRNQARFKSPGGLWGDGSFLYLTDDSTIRKVNIATGEVTTIAGVAGIGARKRGWSRFFRTILCPIRNGSVSRSTYSYDAADRLAEIQFRLDDGPVSRTVYRYV